MPSAGAQLETIAADALFITFPVTDGDSSRWPENIRPPAPTAREVNWLRKMTMDERYACRWRNLVGRGIAKLMDKPDQDKHCLHSFPGGYWMFDHNKGPISNIRHDLYLHGSKNVLRFRSPAEFIPHAYWLLTDPTLSTQNCGCKYCGGGGKKTQTEISEALGLPTNRGPTSVTGSTGLRGGGLRNNSRLTGRGSGPTTVSGGPWVPREKRVSRNIDPDWSVTSLDTDLVSSSARTSDLRSGRTYRLGELVWCAWHAETPRSAKGKETAHNPQLWPAIVIDHVLDVSLDRSLPCESNGSGTIIQSRKHVLLRLGLDSLDSNREYECTLTDAEILPWHAHKLDTFVASSSSKTNSPNSDSFALALKTAENLIRVWAVCDRLPIKVPIPEHAVEDNAVESSNFGSPATPTPSSKPTEELPASIPSTPAFSISHSMDMTPPQRSPVRLAPQSAAKSYRNRMTDDVAGGGMFTSLSSTAAGRPALSQRVYGLRLPQQKVSTMIETRYQGLWYGAERIWTGDLVRLSPEREAFSKSLQLSSKTHGKEIWKETISPSSGAEARGVLLRIDKIFTRIGEEGTKQCTVAGPLYEIALGDRPDRSTCSGIASSWRLPSQKATGSQEPTHPWNIDDIKPPPRDEKETTQEYLFDIPYFTPATPPGYTLRPLLPPGFEMPIPVSYIAGRYYPEILKSSLLTTMISTIPKPAQSLVDFVSTDRRAIELLSLCALAPGRCNSAICVDVRLASRTRMLKDAIRTAVFERSEGKDSYSDSWGESMNMRLAAPKAPRLLDQTYAIVLSGLIEAL